MHLFTKLLAVSSIALVSLYGCNKTSKATAATDVITAAGDLEHQGTTTYQYGTHKLIAPNQTYILKSSSINLDNYVGQNVIITAKNTHYTMENGPELYDVLTIKKQ